ncbi:LysR substrate-binding domain-containing protein [Amphibiibacter pelophylacis]|uniref:LysR substrate-binding domain-containing protein n=1 Tax=Amphibiibacter pelophylacis TaxID=1799477 RepID=A0ACC6P3J5_9BURK
MTPDTRALRYFVAVAEELHFGRAAQRLHMSQPPLSIQIRQLEESLGVRLLHRTQRTVSLTYAGEVFLAQVREGLARLDEAVDSARAAARGQAGLLRVGYTAASAYAAIPALIHAYKLRYPQVEVALHERVTSVQLQELADARLDVGLVRPRVEAPGLASELLMRERLVVAVPADHPLAARPGLTVGDLHDVPFIGFSPQTARYFHDMIETLLAESAVQPRLVQRATQLHAVVALVSAGLGLALVPDASARVQMDRVVFRPLQGEGLPRPELLLCWRRSSTSPLLGHFLEAAREAALRLAL